MIILDKETLAVIERLEQINENYIKSIESTQRSLSICQLILTAATVINVAIVFFTLPSVPDALYSVVAIVVLITVIGIIFKL